jgi:hypothetical protein
MINLLAVLLVLLGVRVTSLHADSPKPDQRWREIYTVLAYGDGVFEPDTWLASAEENADRTTATWSNDTLGALAYAEYLHFDGGVTPEGIDKYFSDDSFKVILSNYEQWERTALCSRNGLTLREFAVTNNQIDYRLRYWTKAAGPTRVLALFIVFPKDKPHELDTYAKRLFPDLVSCQS